MTKSSYKLERGRVLRPRRAAGAAMLIIRRYCDSSGVWWYVLENSYGTRVKLTQAQVRERYRASAAILPVQEWRRYRLRLSLRAPRDGGGMCLYTTTVASPSLGIERRLLVAAPSISEVTGVVQAHPRYCGFVVCAGDTQKLPAAVVPQQHTRGIIASFAR